MKSLEQAWSQVESVFAPPPFHTESTTPNEVVETNDEQQQEQKPPVTATTRDFSSAQAQEDLLHSMRESLATFTGTFKHGDSVESAVFLVPV